jgi:hypothetical protein
MTDHAAAVSERRRRLVVRGLVLLASIVLTDDRVKTSRQRKEMRAWIKDAKTVVSK